MSNNNNRPISGFIASLLNLALAIIVIKVILMYAADRKAGVETNLTKKASTEVRVFWDDVKSGWVTEKDTTE